MQLCIFDPTSNDPKVVGFAAAARLGNVSAVRIAADMYRDRDERHKALHVDLLANELEACCCQAQQMRRVLASPELRGQYQPNSKPGTDHIRMFLEIVGLPLGAYSITKSVGCPVEFLLVLPTDGQLMAESQLALKSYLRPPFPKTNFIFWTESRAVSYAGRDGEKLLEQLDEYLAAGAQGASNRNVKRKGQAAT